MKQVTLLMNQCDMKQLLYNTRILMKNGYDQLALCFLVLLHIWTKPRCLASSVMHSCMNWVMIPPSAPSAAIGVSGFVRWLPLIGPDFLFFLCSHFCCCHLGGIDDACKNFVLLSCWWQGGWLGQCLQCSSFCSWFGSNPSFHSCWQVGCEQCLSWECDCLWKPPKNEKWKQLA